MKLNQNIHIDVEIENIKLDDGNYFVETSVFLADHWFKLVSPYKLTVSSGQIDKQSLMEAIRPFVAHDPHYCYLEAITPVGLERVEVTLGS